MLDITRLIIQSKIECSQTQLNSIKPPLNTAKNRSLRAFKTTLTENNLVEGGFTSIETRTLFTCCGCQPPTVTYSSQRTTTIKDSEDRSLCTIRTFITTKSSKRPEVNMVNAIPNPNYLFGF